jgi:hypothetical protein
VKLFKHYLVLLVSVMVLVGCSSVPSFNIDKDVWSGKATRSGNPETFVTVTFSQSGKSIEGTLGLGTSANTLQPSGVLKGSLEDTALNISTPETALSGTFDRANKTFSGTLTFTDAVGKEEFSLTMSYQKEVDAALLSD